MICSYCLNNMGMDGIVAEDLLKTLFESTREGIIISGSDGGIIAANPAAAKILKYDTTEELIGMHASNLYYREEDRKQKEKVDQYLDNSKFWGKVGAFEGAGYSSEGLYRPMLDCIMFSKGNKPFCKVCEQAIIRVIEHFSE